MDTDKRYEKRGPEKDSERPRRPRTSDKPRSSDRSRSTDRPKRANSNDEGFKVDRPKSDDRKSSWDRPKSGERSFKSDRPKSDDRKSSWDRPKSGERSFKSDRPGSDDRKSSWDRPKSGDRSFKSDRPGSDDRKSSWDRPKSGERSFKSDRPGSDRSSSSDRKFDNKRPTGRPFGRKSTDYEDTDAQFRHASFSSKDSDWRLNKYIANSGVCSRREADTIIADGKVTVNGVVVTELGTKISNKDVVKVDGAEISPEDFTYLLLNKPKNYITTVEDEKGRRTVMDLVSEATGLRVYPVGRLDRNTTGLLLMTNDGDLANRLMHPSYKVKKTYIVETDISFTDEQILQMRQGIQLDDGMAAAHEARRVPGSPNALKISIFEGRNRQIRRMIEFFGLQVEKLHRTYYAGLDIKDIRPGRWRFLKPEEVNNLRMLVKLFDLKQK